MTNDDQHQLHKDVSQDVESIHNPHDKMTFSALNNHDIARDAIKSHLPPALVKQLDLTRMKPHKTKLVSQQMKEFQADVFYEIPFIDSKETALTLVHFEQESNPKRTISLRVWQYLFLALMEYAENHPKQPLPVPYPVVIYTGEAVFNHSTNMFDLFGEYSELAKQHFLDGVHLVDVCRLDDEDIKKHELFGLTELAFKYKKRKDFEGFLDTVIPWLHRVQQKIGDGCTIIYIQYIIEVFQDGSLETFNKKAKEYSANELEEKAMTIAQQLKQESEQRGIQIGEQRGYLSGIREMVLNMIGAGIGKEKAAEIAKIDLKALEELLKDGGTAH